MLLDENDSVYFAYCYPYTYSDCYNFLNRLIKSDPKRYYKALPLYANLSQEMILISCW
jgi:hypothetical protein